MKFVFALAVFAISTLGTQSHAALMSPFVIENRGDQVCRIKPGTAEVCLPTLASLGFPALQEINVRERLRLYNSFLELKKTTPDLVLPASSVGTFGGAVTVAPGLVGKTVSEFDELSVRDIGVARNSKKASDGSTILPFIASVRWKSSKTIKPNGTIYVEGYMRYARANPYEIEAFADSRTEKNVDFLRSLELLGREVHFRAVGTGGKSVDEATLELLRDVVFPTAFGGEDVRVNLSVR